MLLFRWIRGGEGDFLPKPYQLDPLRLGQNLLAGLVSGPVCLDPVAECLLDDPKLSSDDSSRPAGIDHQPHGLVLELRSELPTFASHNEHSLFRGVHQPGSRPDPDQGQPSRDAAQVGVATASPTSPGYASRPPQRGHANPSGQRHSNRKSRHACSSTNHSWNARIERGKSGLGTPHFS